jgi:hypothetical protein
VNPEPKALGDFLKGKQTGVLLNPELVKLIQLIADVARLRSFLLGPPASVPEFSQTPLEPDWCRFFHSWQVEIGALT